MSQQQPKEVIEINQMLTQARSSLHATCGTANGLISDTVTGLLSQIGQRMVSQQMQISQLTKQIEELKKKHQTEGCNKGTVTVEKSKK